MVPLPRDGAAIMATDAMTTAVAAAGGGGALGDDLHVCAVTALVAAHVSLRADAEQEAPAARVWTVSWLWRVASGCARARARARRGRRGRCWRARCTGTGYASLRWE